jgi:hypothetical protein
MDFRTVGVFFLAPALVVPQLPDVQPYAPANIHPA